MTQPIDYCTERGAHLLADRITMYWWERDVTVKCEVVKATPGRGSHHSDYYVVRSDIGMYESRGAR